MKNFINISDISKKELRSIIDKAKARKKKRSGLNKNIVDSDNLLDGKILIMIFEKPSTRTRLSFELAMKQLGGQVLVLNPKESHYGGGDESIHDTAKILSQYGDIVMMRTHKHKHFLEFSKHLEIPIINGLTNLNHPCQIMSDIMTFEEHSGPIAGRVVAWSGDGNNVAASWVHAAVRFGFELRLACPESLGPDSDIVRWAESEGGRVTVSQDPVEAVSGADCVVTDTWFSMGLDDDAERQKVLAPFQVNEDLMAHAKSGALFMHCLPAHRGQEVTANVIDGPHSVVWQGAGNRLHAQKGILHWCLSDRD